MTGEEMSSARSTFRLGRKEFAELLGYTGEARNQWITIKRYENGDRPVPPTIARLVTMLVWFHQDFGHLPNLATGERMTWSGQQEVAG